MLFDIELWYTVNNNGTTQIRRQTMTPLIIRLKLKIILILQILVILHRGTESAHFSISNIRSKIIILTT